LVKSATDGCFSPGRGGQHRDHEMAIVKIAQAQLTPTIASAEPRACGSSAPGSAQLLVRIAGVGPLGVGRARSAIERHQADQPAHQQIDQRPAHPRRSTSASAPPTIEAMR
jgi:hypothetical protein